MSAGTAAPVKRPAEVFFRRALLLVIGAAAFVAVFGGLARLGLEVFPMGSRAMEHGPLLVVGVFGSIVALERAVALGKIWAYLSPLCGVLAATAVLSGLSENAQLLACASAAGLVATNLAIVRRQTASFTWLMLVGSLALLAGNFGWARGGAVSDVVPAWLGFFVLTIVAERLELSRLGATPVWARRALVVFALLLALSLGTALAGSQASVRVMGALLALIACWELRFDLARRTLRMPGLPRFVALAVLLGVAWLLFSGIALVLLGLPPAGPIYDAILHGVLVGFVLSMVFAHAPIILPAVARVQLPFHRVFYLPLALLHIGLLCRVIGDLAALPQHRQAGGVANALAIGLFAMSALWARSRRRQSHTQLGLPRAADRSEQGLLARGQ
jgi:hypothetical protein